MIKIYSKNNYIILEKNNRKFFGIKKDVKVIPSELGENIYQIFNVEKWNSFELIDINEILKENNSNYSLEEWETFYTENTGNFKSGEEQPQNITDALNGASNPSATNVFATMSDINNLSNVVYVETYNDLPNVASASLQDLYVVRTSIGDKYIPNWIGASTYYPKGFYYTLDNLVWEYLMDIPFQATQTEVNTGTNNTNFVTPLTLENADKWDNYLGNSFESVSKNLKSYPFVLNYTNEVLTSVVYTLPTGTITKTLNYTSGVLTSVVLSGATPNGIDLTKTLTYTNEVLTSITYS